MLDVCQASAESLGIIFNCSKTVCMTSHRIRLRLAIRLMANGSLHTVSVGPIGMNFLGFDRLPSYLNCFM